MRFYSAGIGVVVCLELAKNKVIFVSGRSMQFAGKPIYAHNARMFNCVGTFVTLPEIFYKSFYLLLCGCGVGASIQF